MNLAKNERQSYIRINKKNEEIVKFLNSLDQLFFFSIWVNFSSYMFQNKIWKISDKNTVLHDVVEIKDNSHQYTLKLEDDFPIDNFILNPTLIERIKDDNKKILDAVNRLNDSGNISTAESSINSKSISIENNDTGILSVDSTI